MLWFSREWWFLLYSLTKTIAERNKCKIYFWEQPFGKYLINFMQIVFMISIRNAFFTLKRTDGKTVKYLFKDIVITKALRMGKSWQTNRLLVSIGHIDFKARHTGKLRRIPGFLRKGPYVWKGYSDVKHSNKIRWNDRKYHRGKIMVTIQNSKTEIFSRYLMTPKD